MGRAILPLALCLACSTPPSLAVTAPEAIPLTIENTTRDDVVVYLVSTGGKQTRLGLVNANRGRRFRLSLSDLRETPSVLFRQIAGAEWMTERLHPVLQGGSIMVELSRMGGMYGFLSYH
jgi:hypothetical protein